MSAIDSFDEIMANVEKTEALDTKLESAQSELDNNPKLFLEPSLFGEALRLRAELLPKAQRIIKDLQGNDVIIPAQDGIDVLTCTLDELSNALEEAQIFNYKVRTDFLLRVIAIRFKAEFDPSTVTISQGNKDNFNILKGRSTNDVKFLGEAGFGFDVKGNKPKLHRIL